jgi:hypothetical protein
MYLCRKCTGRRSESIGIFERGERRAKRGQVAEPLKADNDEFLSLWFAEQVEEVVAKKM